MKLNEAESKQTDSRTLNLTKQVNKKRKQKGNSFSMVYTELEQAS